MKQPNPTYRQSFAAVALLLTTCVAPSIAHGRSLTSHLWSPLQTKSPAPPQGFSLTVSEDNPLSDTLDPELILARVAPEMGLRAEPAGLTASASGTILHRHYRLWWKDWPVHLARLVIHSKRPTSDSPEIPMGVALWLPEKGAFTSETQTFEFLPLEDSLARSPLGWTSDEILLREEILVTEGTRVTPAWRLVRGHDQTSEEALITVDGALLNRRATHFDAAEADVYPTNPRDSLTRVSLTGLDTSGWLRNPSLNVFGPSTTSRVRESSGQFIYAPSNELSFDQPQAYFTATRALTWMNSRWEDTVSIPPIKIFTQADSSGDRIDTRYVPSGPQGDPAIYLGQDGAGGLKNFARDSDVLIHELTHHALYEFVSSNDGDSGALHEGFADFVAYAMNGDACLGETLGAEGGCLRTALVDPSERLDDPRVLESKYRAGQVWSAILWSLRQEMGPDLDTLIAESWHYLSQETSWQEATLALLSADRDIFADTQNPDHGRHRCAMIRAFVKRGLATTLDGIDASECSIDIDEAITESKKHTAKARKASIPADQRPASDQSVIDLGPLCGVVSSNGNTSSAPLWLMLVLTLCVPLYSRWTAYRQRPHSRRETHGT